MAKISEQKVTFTLSKLIRNEDGENQILDDEMIATIFQVIQEMVGKEVLIELE